MIISILAFTLSMVLVIGISYHLVTIGEASSDFDVARLSKIDDLHGVIYYKVSLITVLLVSILLYNWQTEESTLILLMASILSCLYLPVMIHVVKRKLKQAKLRQRVYSLLEGYNNRVKNATR